ncbi:MAG: hypothetical protein JW716_03245 [Candidatus Aenigmarchaeota archaeon]|nr:hypothetical protein [Candidatus Aenigmarchaeota archaeon]
MSRSFYRSTVNNIIKIFNVLKKAEEDSEMMTISKIASITGIHKWSVSRTIDLYMSSFVEITVPEHLEDVGLQLKIVRLKDPDTKIEQVSNYIKMSKNLETEI